MNIRRSKLTVQILSLVVFSLAAALVWGLAPTNASGINGRPSEPMVAPGEAQQDFSHFKHTNEAHTRLPCLICHKRDDNATRFRMPGNINHEPCAGCHQVQFQNSASGICTICHTGGSDGGPVKSLPGMQDFTSKFNHGLHMRQASCASCHTSNRRGVGYSVPAGANAHTSCFRCHTNQSPIGSCNTCHVGGRPIRNSDAAKAYGVNFSHTAHVRGANLNCTSCHSVLAGTAKGRQVTAPVAAEHFPPGGTSCATCHNNKRAFGPPDFADCKRCHEGNKFKF